MKTDPQVFGKLCKSFVRLIQVSVLERSDFASDDGIDF